MLGTGEVGRVLAASAIFKSLKIRTVWVLVGAVRSAQREAIFSALLDSGGNQATEPGKQRENNNSQGHKPQCATVGTDSDTLGFKG